jgi:hypothetical protein
MRAPISQAEAGTSSNVNVTIGGTLRKASRLLRIRRARNREAMPAALAGSEPVFGSRVCRVNIIPRWLAMDLIDLSGIFFSPYRDRGFTCGIS